MPHIKVTNPITQITRKIRVQDDATWSDVESQIRTIFALTDSDPVKVTYKDEDGDVISISTTEEFRDLVSSSPSTLKFVLGDQTAINSEATPAEASETASTVETPEVAAANPLTEESDWVIAQAPPSEHHSSEESRGVVQEQADAEKTILEDISDTERPAYSSTNGSIDQKSILEPAEPVVSEEPKTVIQEDAASFDAKAKGKGKVEPESAAEGKKVDEKAEKTEKTDEERIAEAIENTIREFLTGNLPAALSHLDALTTHLENIPADTPEEPLPAPRVVYRCVPRVAPRPSVHPLVALGLIPPPFPQGVGLGARCGDRCGGFRSPAVYGRGPFAGVPEFVRGGGYSRCC